MLLAASIGSARGDIVAFKADNGSGNRRGAAAVEIVGKGSNVLAAADGGVDGETTLNWRWVVCVAVI